MVFTEATVALMVLAEARAPLAVVVISSLLAGAAMPSMGPMVRARWSALLAGTARLHIAFSLESVADEIIFMVGPVVVAVLATDVYPAAGRPGQDPPPLRLAERPPGPQEANQH